MQVVKLHSPAENRSPVEIGRTEIISNSLNPHFVTIIPVVSFFFFVARVTQGKKQQQTGASLSCMTLVRYVYIHQRARVGCRWTHKGTTYFFKVQC